MADTPSPMVTTDPLRARPRLFARPHEVAPGVLLHAAFVNSYAVRTPEGLLLVDPGLAEGTRSVRDAVRAWSDAPLHTAVYTHGHADHAFGLRAFLEDGERPRIVAQERCPERFRRYQLTWGWNARINQRQFGLAAPAFPKHFEWPTTTFREALALRLGDLEVRLRAAKGETDDACWLWIPARSQLFTGDLVIWSAPNCGNPQKVQRYPVEWADALEEMAALGAEWLFPGHGLVVQGRDAVRRVLEETARWLRGIAEQVLARMNAGETPEAIVQAVKPDPELSSRPYLRATYDHPQFVVRNLLRLWGGWWDGIASNLLPAGAAAQAREIAGLAGGVDAMVERGRLRLAEGASILAAHLADWAVAAEPAHAGAQALRRDVYAARVAEEPSLMAKGIYRAACNEARDALGEATLPAQTRLSLGGEGEAEAGSLD